MDRILADAGATAGALPMVEFLLERLWRSEPGDVLTHETYDALGGVGGVIAGYAEEVLRERIPRAELPAVRSLMLRLVQPTAAGTALRRPVRAEDLTSPMLAVARELAAARLVVTSRDRESGAVTYELTHDALTRRWQRLADWLKESAEFWQWYESLRISREQQEPLRGARLETARNWLRTNGDDLTPADRDFILASQQRSRRFTWAWRSAAGALVVLLLATGGFAALLQDSNADLEAQLREASARVQAAEATRYLSTDPDKAALTALTAYHSMALPESASALFQVYAQFNQVKQILPDTSAVKAMAVMSDPPSLLTAGGDLRRWRLDGTGRPVSEKLADRAKGVVTDRSGTRFAFIGADSVTVVQPDKRLTRKFTNKINLERFDPSGQALLLRVQPRPEDPIRALIWDLRTDTDTELPQVDVNAAWFGPDAGTVLVKLESGDTEIWDVKAGRAIEKITDDVVGVSPDGSRVVRCPKSTSRAAMRMFDLPGLRQAGELTTSCLGAFGNQLGFDASGELLLGMPWDVNAAGRQRIQVVLTATGEATTLAVPPLGTTDLADRVVPVAVPHDGGWLVAYAGDGGVVLADVARSRLTQLGADLTAYDAEPVDLIGPLAVARSARPARLWELASGRRITGGLPEQERVLIADDRYLFTTDATRTTLSLRDLGDPSQVRHALSTPPSPGLSPSSGGFGPGWACIVRTDSMLVHFNGSVIRRWEYPSLRPLEPVTPTPDDGVDPRSQTGTCAYDADRQLLAVNTTGPYISVWNADTGKSAYVATVDRVKSIRQIAFDQGSHLIAALGERGQVQVVDPVEDTTVSIVTAPQNTLVNACCRIQALHDGLIYLQSGEQFLVWRMSEATVGLTLVLPRSDDFQGLERSSIDDSADTLTVSGTELGVQRFDLDPQKWRQHLCDVVGRGLTAAERDDAATHPDDEDICPGWRG
ncbi:nSTAND1 domain-containing NTPase [Catellatospora citrea]|uniref:Novel STAND NTPase 1 domain-containing protein n=1 Tax=Catellatospora citrea TaxID=53366 RepID=A0A8J3KF71_9ACTN|nr:hypothetical protein [Catellatospora citrea]GIF99494.1 hypothetical protein Cci01nite_45880 [Catellatospora citrea]